jgi:hypothetical protein
VKGFVAALAIGGVAVFVVLALRHALRAAWVLTGRNETREEGPDLELLRLEDARDAALRNLREVHFDHETGKIDDHDFAELRVRYEGRAAEAMRAIDARGEGA